MPVRDAPGKGDAERDQGDDPTEDVPQVFGDSRKIPAQMSLIAHYVRKSGGRPRMLLLPLGELPLEEGFFSDRVYEVGVSAKFTCCEGLGLG